VAKAKCFCEEANLSNIIFSWQEPFIKNKFLWVHGLANFKHASLRQNILTFKQNWDSTQRWLPRPKTNVRKTSLGNRMPIYKVNNKLFFMEIIEWNFSKVFLEWNFWGRFIWFYSVQYLNAFIFSIKNEP
jgi:hypothetical protein